MKAFSFVLVVQTNTGVRRSNNFLSNVFYIKTALSHLCRGMRKLSFFILHQVSFSITAIYQTTVGIDKNFLYPINI